MHNFFCAPGFMGKSKFLQLFGDFMVCLRAFQSKATPALGPHIGIQGSQDSWLKLRMQHTRLLKQTVNSTSWVWWTCFVRFQLMFLWLCGQLWKNEWQLKTQPLKKYEWNGKDLRRPRTEKEISSYISCLNLFLETSTTPFSLPPWHNNPTSNLHLQVTMCDFSVFSFM